MSGVTLHSDLKKNAAVEGQCWCHFFPFLKLLYCLPQFMPKSFCVSILSLSLILTTLHFEMSWCMEKHPIKAQDSHKLKMLLRWEAMYSLCWDSSLPIKHNCWYTKAFAVKCLFIISKMPLTEVEYETVAIWKGKRILCYNTETNISEFRFYWHRQYFEKMVREDVMQQGTEAILNE